VKARGPSGQTALEATIFTFAIATADRFPEELTSQNRREK
jgi:hypothetical protein